MCSTFSCISCKETFFNRCRKVAFDSRNFCESIYLIENPTSCETCITVDGTINRLQALVFQAPFLVTDGMGGLDSVQSWRRKEVEDALKSKAAWDSLTESRAERHCNAQRVQDMGLGNVLDAREEHQGFSMALTPKGSFHEASQRRMDRKVADEGENDKGWESGNKWL